MKLLLIAFTTPMLVLCVMAIFVVLFATILRALKEMSLFTLGTSIVVALSVTVLCLIGLHHFLVSGENDKIASRHAAEIVGQTGIEIILLPYAALAIAILLCLLLLGISIIFPIRRRVEHPARKKAQVINSEQVQNINQEKRIRK
jgi:uncharacterized membrane protein